MVEPRGLGGIGVYCAGGPPEAGGLVTGGVRTLCTDPRGLLAPLAYGLTPHSAVAAPLKDPRGLLAHGREFLSLLGVPGVAGALGVPARKSSTEGAVGELAIDWPVSGGDRSVVLSVRRFSCHVGVKMPRSASKRTIGASLGISRTRAKLGALHVLGDGDVPSTALDLHKGASQEHKESFLRREGAAACTS